jgi:N-glycosylase/DNA lyase
MAAKKIVLPAIDYDLGATLDSGQVFRWQCAGDVWTGVIQGRWVRLRTVPEGIQAETHTPAGDWRWLKTFLQTEVDMAGICRTFPQDEPMGRAVAACRGLRLLRQDPWECLASFILSSTKQIVQIRQIVQRLCEDFGDPVPAPAGEPPVFSFPGPDKIAAATEARLRACKMGFRAPYLLAAAEAIADGKISLAALRQLSRPEARLTLMELPGVGGKIADCVLLFAYGFDTAFPVDVWIARALQQLYFPKKAATEKELHAFAASYFGPHAGYAQQYLFHYIRTKLN